MMKKKNEADMKWFFLGQKQGKIKISAVRKVNAVSGQPAYVKFCWAKGRTKRKWWMWMEFSVLYFVTWGKNECFGEAKKEKKNQYQQLMEEYIAWIQIQCLFSRDVYLCHGLLIIVIQYLCVYVVQFPLPTCPVQPLNGLQLIIIKA